MSQKVLIATGEFGESLEVHYCFLRLEEEGIEPTIAAPKDKLVQLVVHDTEPGYDTYTERFGYHVQADVAYAKVKPERYDGLILPGGRAPEEIRNDPGLLHTVRHFLATDKPIGAIGRGITVLYAAGSIEGTEVTTTSGIRTEVEIAGGIYRDQKVVVCDRLVTSRDWRDLSTFLREFLNLLK